MLGDVRPQRESGVEVGVEDCPVNYCDEEGEGGDSAVEEVV